MKNPVLIHKHLIIRAEANRVPTDEEQLTEWMKEFIDSIDMKILMGPYVKYCTMEGNRLLLSAKFPVVEALVY